MLYLSTYLGQDTQFLLYEDKTILKSDLQAILNVSKPTANKFYKDCIDIGLLENHDKDGLYLIGNLFFKGKASNKERIKLFRLTIQQLYKKLSKKNHKYFGYIIQLVPWINYEWNIVCHNPQETNKNRIEPMTFRDVCKKLGYDPEHTGRLKTH